MSRLDDKQAASFRLSLPLGREKFARRYLFGHCPAAVRLEANSEPLDITLKYSLSQKVGPVLEIAVDET